MTWVKGWVVEKRTIWAEFCYLILIYTLNLTDWSIEWGEFKLLDESEFVCLYRTWFHILLPSFLPSPSSILEFTHLSTLLIFVHIWFPFCLSRFDTHHKYFIMYSLLSLNLFEMFSANLRWGIIQIKKKSVCCKVYL